MCFSRDRLVPNDSRRNAGEDSGVDEFEAGVVFNSIRDGH